MSVDEELLAAATVAVAEAETLRRAAWNAGRDADEAVAALAKRHGNHEAAKLLGWSEQWIASSVHRARVQTRLAQQRT